MPCDASYMNPTKTERNSKEICQHLVYIGTTTNPQGWKPDERIRKGAEEYYGLGQSIKDLDEVTQLLCAVCIAIEKSGDADAIIYDGKSKKARNLANWWDDHKKVDDSKSKMKGK